MRLLERGHAEPWLRNEVSVGVRGSADIVLARAVTAGRVFETGRPVAFPFVHNAEPAPRLRRGGRDQFQQRVEPAGFYVIVDEDPSGPLARGWVRGVASFKSPIVLAWNAGSGGYDELSWKARLSAHYGGRRGAALSRALLRDGHDAVVTVDAGGQVSEVVDLSRVRGGRVVG